MVRSLGSPGVGTTAFAHVAAGGSATRGTGIARIGDPQHDGDVIWNHDRGQDGTVHEIIGRDRSAS